MIDTATPTVVTMPHATLYLGDANELLPRIGWVENGGAIFDHGSGGIVLLRAA